MSGEHGWERLRPGDIVQIRREVCINPGAQGRVQGMKWDSTWGQRRVFVHLFDGLGEAQLAESQLEPARRSRLDRFLCWLGCHDWREMDMYCRSCGRQDLW